MTANPSEPPITLQELNKLLEEAQVQKVGYSAEKNLICLTLVPKVVYRQTTVLEVFLENKP